MSTGRQNLGQQGLGPDAVFFADVDTNGEYVTEDPTTSYEPWFRGHNHVEEVFDITSNNTSFAYGPQPIVFEIDKRGDQMGKVQLQYQRSAVTTTDATHFACFPDFEGYACLEKVRWIYGNKDFHEAQGEELYRKMTESTIASKRISEGKLQNGNLTELQRRVIAQSASNVCLDLQVPWDDMHKKIPSMALPNKIRVEVTMKPLSRCLKTNITTPACTITTMKLRCHFTHLTAGHQVEKYREINSGEGVAIKTLTSEYHWRETVANDTTLQRIKIRNIKNCVSQLSFTIRKQSEIDTASTYDPWNFIRPARWYLTDNGQRITDIMEMNDSTDGSSPAEYRLWSQEQEMHPTGINGLYIGKMAFCPHELVERNSDHAYGGRTFSGYNNLELVFQFDSAPGAVCYMDIWGDIHNLLVYQKGDIRKFLV